MLSLEHGRTRPDVAPERAPAAAHVVHFAHIGLYAREPARLLGITRQHAACDRDVNSLYDRQQFYEIAKHLVEWLIAAKRYMI